MITSLTAGALEPLSLRCMDFQFLASLVFDAHSLVSRLTNVAPFNEDKTQQDFRIRIANRTIEWSALDERDLSFAGSTLTSETIYFDLHHS